MAPWFASSLRTAVENSSRGSVRVTSGASVIGLLLGGGGRGDQACGDEQPAHAAAAVDAVAEEHLRVRVTHGAVPLPADVLTAWLVGDADALALLDGDVNLPAVG